MQIWHTKLERFKERKQVQTKKGMRCRHIRMAEVRPTRSPKYCEVRRIRQNVETHLYSSFFSPNSIQHIQNGFKSSQLLKAGTATRLSSSNQNMHRSI